MPQPLYEIYHYGKKSVSQTYSYFTVVFSLIQPGTVNDCPLVMFLMNN